MTASAPITSAPVRDYLLRLQDRICQELEREDGARFGRRLVHDEGHSPWAAGDQCWQRPHAS
jgi:coproporphyrinogen III oxidase